VFSLPPILIGYRYWFDTVSDLSKLLFADATGKIIRQSFSAFANPADLTGRISDDKGVVGHIPRHHRSGADKRISAECCSANDGGIGTDGRPPLHQRGPNLIHLADCRTGIVDVGEHYRRAAKDIVLQGHPFVDGDIVLDLAPLTNHNVGPDDNVLSDVTVGSDHGVGQNMGKMPDFRTRTDGYRFVQDCRFVYEKITRIGVVRLFHYLFRSVLKF
jgi:hypothetical protein